MNRRPVTSSNVASMGWDEDGSMEVEYRSGHIYVYYEVPESVYQSLLGAESIGRELNTVKGRYQCNRLK
jgi:hypothetical protein